jgi:hypothetical protein
MFPAGGGAGEVLGGMKKVLADFADSADKKNADLSRRGAENAELC